MKGSGRQRWTVGVATFVAALGLALVTPSEPRAASADCGENSGSVCWENKSCLDILFYKQCTTEYRYYSSSSGGEAGGDDDTARKSDLPSDCTWGEDYLGWGRDTC